MRSSKRVLFIPAFMFAIFLSGCPIQKVPAPEAPSDVSLSLSPDLAVIISWIDCSDDETGFEIEESVNGGAFACIAKVAAESQSYVQQATMQGATYDIRVRAVKKGAASEYSDAIRISIPSYSVAAPTGLKAVAVDSSTIALSWADNSSNETSFSIEASTYSPTTGFSQVAVTEPDVLSWNQTSGITPGQKRWYRVRAHIGSLATSAYTNTVTVTTQPAGTFKVANSWGVGGWENVPDGFYYITYQALINASAYVTFYEDRPAYSSNLQAYFKITHPRRGDLTIVLGLGNPSSPVMTKTVYSLGIGGDSNALSDDLMICDISEFTPYIGSNQLFLKVTDNAYNSSTGTVNSMYLGYRKTGASGYIGSHTIFPLNTVNGSSVYAYVDTSRADIVNSPILLNASGGQGSVAPARSIFASHAMTDADYLRMRSVLGVFEPGRSYNRIVDGHGTGLCPPTEAEWDGMRSTVRIVDSRQASGIVQAAPFVDLSALKAFPPIGNQGGQGSCCSWSMAYYIKTFQQSFEHGWDLSTISMVGSYPYAPDSQQEKLASPLFVYHLINGGVDRGSTWGGNMNVICSLGAASWKTAPYSDDDYSSWPSYEAWNEAPAMRGAVPSSSDFGISYAFYVDSAEKVAILKTLLANNIPVSIGVDAGLYGSNGGQGGLTGQDVWNEDNYRYPVLNHANTIVGYCDR